MLEGTEANNVEYDSLKEALMQMVEALSNIEQTFTGRLKDEVFIDPIAVYVEL